MITQMAKYLDTVYVSGWQCSSTASSTDEPSPDLADYPMVWEPFEVPIAKTDIFRIPYLTRFSISSWPNFSTTESNVKSESLHPKRAVAA